MPWNSCDNILAQLDECGNFCFSIVDVCCTPRCRWGRKPRLKCFKFCTGFFITYTIFTQRFTDRKNIDKITLLMCKYSTYSIYLWRSIFNSTGSNLLTFHTPWVILVVGFRKGEYMHILVSAKQNDTISNQAFPYVDCCCRCRSGSSVWAGQQPLRWVVLFRLRRQRHSVISGASYWETSGTVPHVLSCMGHV